MISGTISEIQTKLDGSNSQSKMRDLFVSVPRVASIKRALSYHSGNSSGRRVGIRQAGYDYVVVVIHNARVDTANAPICSIDILGNVNEWNNKTAEIMANELRQLVDTANAPIFGIDPDSNVNEWNDKTTEIKRGSFQPTFNFEIYCTPITRIRATSYEQRS